MHLCYLLPPIEFYSPQLGGAIATMAMQQGRRLQAQGIRVSVIAPHEDEQVYDVGEFHALKGVTYKSLNLMQRGLSTKIRLRFNKFDWLYFEHYRARAQEVLRKIQPDAVLCFNGWQAPLLVKQAVPDARVFLRLSNECHTRLASIEPTMQALERVFALSTYIREWTIKHYQLSDEKFTLLPNGADLDSFFAAPDVFERVADAQTPLRALFLSRLDPSKGPDLAADAVYQVQQEGLPVELSVAGNVWFRNGATDESPFVNVVREKAERAGAGLLGHIERPSVPQLVRDHDVLLLPIRENDPMTQVVFEAMASGLAVISCPLGGVPEACGDAALWAKPDDVASVVAHLRTLCQDRHFLIECKKRSLERAQQMTWDHNAAIFRQVLDNPLA